MAEYDPPKWNLMECWRYATRNGLVEEEGDPTDEYMDGDSYLLIEKKEHNGEVTFWGTLYPTVTRAAEYTRSLGYRGPSTTSDMGWKVVYLFDLNTGEPLPTTLAFDNRD